MGDKVAATFHGETEADRTRRMTNDQVMWNHRMVRGDGLSWHCRICGDDGSRPCTPRRWGDQDNLAAPAAGDSNTSKGTEQ
jgi:hypothetical protein